MAPRLLAVVFAAAGSLGVFSGGSWASIGIGGVLLVSLLIGLGQGRLAWPSLGVSSFIGLLLGAAALSCFYAVDVRSSVYAFLKLCTILLPLLLWTSPDFQRTSQTLLKYIPAWIVLSILAISLLSVVMLSILLVLTLSGAAVSEEGPLLLTKLNRGYSYELMLCFPFMAYLLYRPEARKRNWVLLGLLLIAVMNSLFLTHSRATQMGEVAALIVFAVSAVSPFLVIGGLAFIGLLSVGWPWAASYMFVHHHDLVSKLPDSWIHRVEIWDYSYYRIIEAPLAGHGLGGASKVDWAVPHGAMYVYAHETAAHSHNAMVQLWVELGAWGAGAGLLMMGLVLHRIWHLPAKLRPSGAAAFIYVFCLLMSAYNFWTDSLWAAMALTCFAFLVVGKHFDCEKKRS